MARVQLAPILSNLAGKLANAVFTQGRSVLALRTRVKPMNPQSSFQTAVRAALKSWTTAWRSLDPNKITAWNTYALTAKKSNRWGDKYYSTGHKTYVAWNVQNTLEGDGTEVEVPFEPVAPTPVGVSAMDADATLGHFTVTTDDAVGANTKLMIWATPQLSAGVTNAKGKLVHIKTFAAGTAAGDLDIKSDYETHFGSLIKDTKIFVQTYLTNVEAALKVTTYKNGAELSGKVK